MSDDDADTTPAGPAPARPARPPKGDVKGGKDKSPGALYQQSRRRTHRVGRRPLTRGSTRVVVRGPLDSPARAEIEIDKITATEIHEVPMVVMKKYTKKRKTMGKAMENMENPLSDFLEASSRNKWKSLEHFQTFGISIKKINYKM